MTVASYSTDLNDMDLAEAITGWAESTASGWTSIDRPVNDTDDFIQNIKCNSSAAKTGVGVLFYNNGAGITLNQDDAVLMWCKWDAAPLLATEASGGLRTCIGDALDVFYAFNQLGSDSYPYGGWRNLATGDPADSEVSPDTTVGSPSTTKQYFGWAFNAPIDVPGKGNPYKVDAVRYGRCEIICINGDATAYGTAAGMAQENDYNDGTNGYNRWGLFQAIDGGYLWKGLMSLGTAATVVDFRDSAVAINIEDTKHTTKNFNKIEINNSGSRVDWTGYTFSALGTKSPGRLEVVDNADVNLDGCTFNDMDTFIFQSNSAVLDSAFVRCGQITHGGAVMNGSSVSGYEGTADTSALIYNETVNPVGEMDNMTFTRGAALTHAIEFGTSSPLTINLSGIAFSGYNASDEQTDSTFHVKRTTDTVTINVSGCSGNISYKSEGATVVIAADPSTLTVVVKAEATGSLLADARVYIEAAAGGTMTEGDVILAAELTGADGEVVATISGSDQPYTGLVTEAASPGFYVAKPISGTIPAGDSILNVGLVLDE
jgi:hypothetical protein